MLPSVFLPFIVFSTLVRPFCFGVLLGYWTLYAYFLYHSISFVRKRPALIAVGSMDAYLVLLLIDFQLFHVAEHDYFLSLLYNDL